MNMRQLDRRNEQLLQIALFGQTDLPTFAKYVPKRRQVVRLSLNMWIGFWLLVTVVTIFLAAYFLIGVR